MMSAVAWVAASVAGPLLVGALVDRPARRRFSVLGGAVMGYVGRRSYALYLWHYPWLTWLRSSGLPGVAGALAGTLASAELSWRLVEAPMLGRRRRFVSPPAIVPTSWAQESSVGDVRADEDPVEEGPEDGVTAPPSRLIPRGAWRPAERAGARVRAAEAV
jgi:peptidoglycan/LPS O-acetylase OafA/YrhL